MAMPLHEPADSPEAVFHIHGVTKVYRMGDVEVHALRGVDLDLYGGEFVVVLGPESQRYSILLAAWMSLRAVRFIISITISLRLATGPSHASAGSMLVSFFSSTISFRALPH